MASARRTVSYRGLRALAWKLVESAVRPYGQIGLESICHKDLTGPIEAVRARIDVTIGIAGEADVDQLVHLVGMNWPGDDEFGPYHRLGHRGTVVDRLARGQRCFVARLGDEIVHYNWISLDREEAIAGTGLVAELEPGVEAVCHDGFTVAAHRGQGVHPAVNNAMLRWLRDAGYRSAWTVVGTLDRSSNITHHRLDWEFAGVLLYVIASRTRRARTWRVRGSLGPFATARR